ncbi:4251_t:CDS:1, partial [Dentiscutata erythropus]
LQLKLLPSQYLEKHEDIIMKAAEIYEFTNIKTFTNIYEMQLKRITDDIQVDHVVNALIPAVRDKHVKIFKKYENKEWVKIKYSEAFSLWKGVIDVKTELELISSKVVVLNNSDINNLEDSLKHLTPIPKWNERLQNLSRFLKCHLKLRIG